MDIYDFLIVKKRGAAYKKEQVTNSSLYNHPLDPNKQVRGNSRIWGDVSAENQKIVIDKIISLGSRLHLSYKDISYALLLCYAESGFNPDAAAGTTSASGLAQYTRGTMKSFSARAKKYLSQDLTMTPQNVFEVDIGVYGVIAAYLFNKDLVTQWIKPNNSSKFWQTIYMLHHDGPGYYTDDRGRERAIKGKWRADAIKTYNTKILPKLSKLEALLTNSTAGVKIQLEDSNGQPIQNKEYVVAAPANTSKASTPAKLSTDRKAKKSYNIIHGKTDAHGFTKELVSAIGCELIVLLCSNKPKKLGKAVSQEEYKKHTVKKGDTLSKIARNNGTTVAELAKDNQIKNPDKITTGQKLIIKRKYLRHKPSGSAVKEILEQAGLGSYSKDSIIYAQNHVVKPDGSTSASAGHKKENTVTLRTPTPASEVNKKTKEVKKKENHNTNEKGDAKTIHHKNQEEDLIILRVRRKWHTKNSTISEYNVEGTLIKGYILERPGPDTTKSRLRLRVPEGTYKVVWHNSPKFKRKLLKLYNNEVPLSRQILIHKGNSPKDTDGCLLPGESRAVDFVGISEKKVSELNKYLGQFEPSKIRVIITNE